MKQDIFSFSDIQTNSNELEKTSSKMDLSQVFAQREGQYLNELTLFLAHFNSIPNFVNAINIDCKKANKWFLEKYKQEIKDLHYVRRCYNGSKTAELDDVFYFLYEDLIVDFDTNLDIVRFLFRKTDMVKIEPIINGIYKFRQKSDTPFISLLYASDSGINTRFLKITKPRLNIDDNYNDDFREVHQTILKRLSKKNDKGLVLLHGEPGTGKTTYIRYLISSVKKNVIFLPPNMASAITNPDFISILMDNRNSIFVIEDAENIIINREKGGSSPVSAILNISDGLVSDCLNIQVICSFNTNISKVDSALLRKGRLIAKYEFKELEPDKATALSKKLGFDACFNEPATLAAIYNHDDKDFQEAKGIAIGFKS